MVLCGTKNVSSMASLEEPFEAHLFLRVYSTKYSQKGEEKKARKTWSEYFYCAYFPFKQHLIIQKVWKYDLIVCIYAT